MEKMIEIKKDAKVRVCDICKDTISEPGQISFKYLTCNLCKRDFCCDCTKLIKYNRAVCIDDISGVNLVMCGSCSQTQRGQKIKELVRQFDEIHSNLYDKLEEIEEDLK
jgi:hypothetical protein